MGRGGFWVSLGFLVSWGDADQCCKVYQLHDIVIAVTAIFLFYVYFIFPRQWLFGTGMHKTLSLFMIFTHIVCIFVF